ncbi:MAG: hypothetical protein V3T58_05645 [Candidatus Hydrothermarchaeales archaeon]
MLSNIEYLIAGIGLVVGVITVILASITAKKLKGGTLYWSSLLLLVTGLVFVVHAGIEVAGLGRELYAVTSLVATLLLGFTLVIIDITTQKLGDES